MSVKRWDKGLEPSLLDKLFDDSPKQPGDQNIFKASSLGQYKETVARDLEGLLNSRMALSETLFDAFPQCRKSLMVYGLRDFSAMSLVNAYDRALICRSLEDAISRHEPRLHDVTVTLDEGNAPGGGLHFTIHALLDIRPAREPVSFDAMLQPSTLQYSVSGFRRNARVS